MIVIAEPPSFEYVSDAGDWRLRVGGGVFTILPQVGGLQYSSGVNLDNLSRLIVDAKAHAITNGINWDGN